MCWERSPRCAGCARKLGNYRKGSELDSILAPFTIDLAAGVPYEMVAQRTGLTEKQVAHWRVRQGIERAPGRPSRFVMTRFMARALVGRAAPAVEHPVRAVGNGEWTPPEYLLRVPLHYDTFVHIVGVLVGTGMSIDAVALGLGVAARDVSLAFEVHQRSGA